MSDDSSSSQRRSSDDAGNAAEGMGDPAPDGPTSGDTSAPAGSEQASGESIVGDLIRRRVPQVLAGYLGVTWTLFELMQWLTDQYLVSPYLGQAVLFGLLMLVPAVLLVTYRHGRPGPDRWTQLERYGTVANVVVALLVLGLAYGDTELGSMVKMVRAAPGDTTAAEDTTQAAKTQAAPRQVPKKEFRKRVALFYFENKSGEPRLDWARYGLPEALETDLDQDLFVRVSTGFVEKLRQKGFEDATGAPLTLKQEIAQKARRQHFLTGSLRPSDSGVTVRTELRETETGDLVEARTVTGSSVLDVTDRVSVQLRKDLDIPSAHLQQTEDLPAAELTTSSPKAFRAYAKGLAAWQIRNDLDAGQQALEKAVGLDSTFALAQWRLFSVCRQQNRSTKAEAAISAAMEHYYKLPLRYQFEVKDSFYSWNQEPDKRLEVAKMRVEFYPEDVEAHLQLAGLYQQRNRNEAALRQYRRVLEIAPSPEQYYDSIGDIQKEMGRYEEARSSYRKYANHFPKDPDPFRELGSLFQRTGDLDSAATYFEKAHLLEPENVRYLVRLGLLRTFRGKFDAALQTYEKAQDAATTLSQRAQVLTAQIGHYRIRGQIEKALQVREQLISMPSAPPSFVIRWRAITAFLYAEIGEEDKALRIIEKAQQEAQPPLDRLASLGRVGVFKATQNAKALEKLLPKYQSVIENFGLTARQWVVEMTRGDIRRLRGECPKALPLYEEALSYNPRAVQKVLIRVQKARCYRREGQLEKAQAEVEKALRKVPIHPEALREKALIHQKRGEEAKAADATEEALRVYEPADSAHMKARRVRSLHDDLTKT